MKCKKTCCADSGQAGNEPVIRIVQNIFDGLTEIKYKKNNKNNKRMTNILIQNA